MRAVAWIGLVSGMAAAGTLVGCGDDDGATSPDAGSVDVLYDETYTASCSLTSCRSSQLRTACTCVERPRDMAGFESNRVGCGDLIPPGGGGMRNPEDDFCDAAGGGGPPNVGCFMPSGYIAHGTPRMVTLYGWVDVFGNGGDSGDVRVRLYQEGVDGELGAMIGETTSMIAADAMDACAKTEIEYSGDREVGNRNLGFYRIDNVPTETPLVMQTSGQTDLWTDLYTYNFQILNGEVDASAPAPGSCEAARTISGDRFRYTARTLSLSASPSIPLTAGLPSGVQPGNGAVAGEAHDCDNVRIEYAQIAVQPVPESFVYFNNEPDNPVPVTGRTEGTSLLGLYAALDIPPGPVDVAGVARIGTDVVSLGWYRARVFPNAVTVVTLRGLRSQQH